MWGRPVRYTVLIATAEPPLPGLLPDFLRQPSIRALVRPLDDLDAAVDCIRREKPRVVVDDARDEAGGGVELHRRLRACDDTRALPVILVGPRRTIDPALDAVVDTPIVLREYFDVLRRFVPLPRRRHLRHAVNLRFEFVHDGAPVQAFSRDLSPYGAFLKTDRAVAEGAVIRVHFRLPGEERLIDVDAVVRRCAPYDPSARAMAGLAIEFVGMADDDLHRLDAFVGRHLPRPLLGLPFGHGS